VASPTPAVATSHSVGTLQSAGSRKALGGFFVSGLLLAFLGAILPSWQHHLTADYLTIGLYFAGVTAGIVSSVWISPALLMRRGIGWVMSVACALACAAMLYLAAVTPPMAAGWRIGGLFALGLSAGSLHTAIFYAISPIYRHNPAATVNLSGILFGSGSLAIALFVAMLFYTYTVPSTQILIATIPGFFALGYARSRFPDLPARNQSSAREILAELKSPAAVLFSLLLFFQFGNEWAIAGWLPIFLTQRLGMSPASALWLLALYFAALIVGRVVAQTLLSRVSHARLLISSALAAVLGCVILLATDNRFGAITAILLVGAGFAPIYPLVVEKIGSRFPSYHPGFSNGIFSFALTGGLLAPCTLGYYASFWGVRVVMGLPLIGSLAVFVLILLIWLEAWLTRSTKRS
jgi:fucose permease